MFLLSHFTVWFFAKEDCDDLKIRPNSLSLQEKWKGSQRRLCNSVWRCDIVVGVFWGFTFYWSSLDSRHRKPTCEMDRLVARSVQQRSSLFNFLPTVSWAVFNKPHEPCSHLWPTSGTPIRWTLTRAAFLSVPRLVSSVSPVLNSDHAAKKEKNVTLTRRCFCFL